MARLQPKYFRVSMQRRSLVAPRKYRTGEAGGLLLIPRDVECWHCMAANCSHSLTGPGQCVAHGEAMGSGQPGLVGRQAKRAGAGKQQPAL
jgi:hypothetical protein